MLIRQTALYLPAQLLGPLAQLAAIVLWTHWLDPKDFGLFTLVMAAQEAIYLLALYHWSQYLLRFLPGADAAARRRMDTIETWMFLANAALQFLALLILLRVVLGAWPAAGLAASLSAFVLTRSYGSHFGERAKVDGAIGVYTVLQTVGPVAGLVLGWAWSLLAKPGPAQALGVYAIAQTLALVVALPALRLRPSLRAPDRELLRRACSYGLPLALSAALAWVPGNGIRFLIEHGLGLAAVGLFSVGWTLGQRACAFAAMLVTAAAFPIALRLEADGRHQQALEQLAQNGALVVAVLLPVAVGLILLAGPFATLAVSAPYVPATLTILPIATLAGLIKNLRSHVANQPFLLAQRTGLTLAIDALETLLFLLGAALGLHLLGLAGAAWGALAAVAVGAVISFALAFRRFRMPVPGVHLARIALATAGMGLALRLLPAAAGWGALVAGVVFGMAVYASVLAFLYRGQLGKLRGALSPPV